MGCGQRFALVGKDTSGGERLRRAYVFLKHMWRFPLNEGDWCHCNDAVFLDSFFHLSTILFVLNSFLFSYSEFIYFCVFLFLSLFSVSKQLGYLMLLKLSDLVTLNCSVLGNVIDFHSVSFHQMHIMVHFIFISFHSRYIRCKYEVYKMKYAMTT